MVRRASCRTHALPCLTHLTTLIGLVAALCFGASLLAQSPARPAPPRLVVVVVVDQFRADYVSMYGHQWTRGLRRLVDGGAVFTRAAFPYAATYTCAGHATIGTGTQPVTHGMASNTFFNRQTNQTVPCAFDETVTSVPFGGARGQERHSPRALRAPTFAETLRGERPGAQVVSLALKPRSAITLAGRGGPNVTVVWEEDDGTWATSDAYTKEPWRDVDAFVRAHPLTDAYGEVWTRLLPDASYLHSDDGAGEGQPAPWTRVFPHPLESKSGEPDSQFVSAWERSPWSDAFLTDLALHLLASRKLGAPGRTDFLSISLPALDLVGHEFGPRSHEVQDVLARIDVLLGRLLDALDRQVGRGRYVLALSSDHGVATIPEQVTAAGDDGGRTSSTQVRNSVGEAITKILGASPVAHVTAVFDQQIALGPGVMDRLRSTPGAVDAVKAAALSVPGIGAVYSADEVLDRTFDDGEPALRSWRLTYVDGRGGDFVLVPKRQWMLRSGSGTTHGTPQDYDQRVPLVLFGAGIRAGRIDASATPADIAPTLARIVGIAMPSAQGRVLTEALAR
jgi:predicted AlkP superfamily pyrophosphatase or phosphodiesterase